MPAPRWTRPLLCGALAAALPLTGCTARPAPPRPISTISAGALRLVAFDSCQQLLDDLRSHTKKVVGPWGLPGDRVMPAAAADSARAAEKGAADAPAPTAPHSGTNNHEQDADEPDIVKTDGRRIVTVTGNRLRVVDAASRRTTGRLHLGVAGDAQVLLAGDAALVLVRSADLGAAIDRVGPPLPNQAQLILVDLRGTPRVVSRYTGDGTMVDARQTGTVARVVLRATPEIALPDRPNATEDDRLTANRAAVGRAPLESWLPDWSVTTGTATTSGKVGCDRVSRPADFSGTSLLTVLTFDLTAPALTDGDPVTVVADADTVYGTGTSLYLAGDQRWRFDAWPEPAGSPKAGNTEIYRLDLHGADRPRYAAAGSVPGRLVNQYALSEWNGHLRVATTDDRSSASAVRVLEQRGDTLAPVGVVDGLGHGERIYSVRFIGPRGYVVTFRQTDPLYAVDLADPKHPTVTGELKITGYSAHLQPVGEGRLIGVGQEADTKGRISGMQVSLFDTTDPAQPRRLAQHHIADGQSDAEWDPHALLWWPASRLLVVPVTTYDPRGRSIPAASALALRVTDGGLTEVGKIAQPQVVDGMAPTVRRTLVVGDVLWTVSDFGLQASNLSTMDRLAWLPNA
ncbi:putative secreted protein with C-terminal beta-propeller domain [Krasilnikovia cinnamomea]|uniref:Putative secreted protein with C-terminal beta-propeller domain n=1 Tax=Krasilnikovia cinnamomea TaxID=349313 RepID=A0A4Q7ZJK7_9ACTN|nr:beta-propeller domain-containing protein [Krasilnikovia cinnamomea]RZU51072.1 putative secreted protein with C-terminal beta-propeller domain [Krasilnikovia cinnamomea]